MVEAHKRQRKEMDYQNMYEKPYDKTAESDDNTKCWIWDRRQTYKKKDIYLRRKKTTPKRKKKQNNFYSTLILLLYTPLQQ